jgi:hypothetical protein
MTEPFTDVIQPPARSPEGTCTPAAPVRRLPGDLSDTRRVLPALETHDE